MRERDIERGRERVSERASVCVCDVTVVFSGYGGAELFKLSLVSVYRFLKRVMSFVFVTQLCFYGVW